jgi:hypothetical protein
MAKRKLDKRVKRTVRVIVGGRCVKTVNQRVGLQQAMHEIGEGPLMTEGRLITGLEWRFRRKVVGSVRVEVAYLCDPRPELNDVMVTAGILGVTKATIQHALVRGNLSLRN